LIQNILEIRDKFIKDLSNSKNGNKFKEPDIYGRPVFSLIS